MKFHSDLFGWEYVWRNFADTLKGEAISEETKQGEELEALTLPIPQTTASVLITPVVHYGKRTNSGTTAMVQFPAADDFSFNIHTESIADQLGKAFGAQDVQVNDPLFDGRFLIQGNNPARIQEIFESIKLRELLLLQPPAQFGVITTNFDPEWVMAAGHHAIIYRFDLLMDKLDQLQNAYDIVVTTLEQLYAAGAVESDTVPQEQPRTREASIPSQRLRSPLLDRK